MNTIFQLKKKQEIGFFVMLNDGGEETINYFVYIIKKINHILAVLVLLMPVRF